MTTTRLPKTITAGALLATPIPPVKWIIPGLLPAGLAIFAGPSKAGKSWLTLWLCLQISQGNQDERRFDFHGLGMALKQAREEKGWTQAYVAELVGKTDRTIMNIENKGQHPSFNLFFKLVTLFDISVDQFFYTEGHRGEGSCRKHIDVLLSSMNEKELVVMEATAEGLKKARETEVQE